MLTPTPSNCNTLQPQPKLATRVSSTTRPGHALTPYVTRITSYARVKYDQTWTHPWDEVAINPSPTIAIFEILGLTIWLIAFSLETLADRQKLAFLVAMKKANKPRMVCNVGLWRYTRHPNYFAEWMVWNGVVIAAIPEENTAAASAPSWTARRSSTISELG